jgi:hypothetical protein
VIARRADCRGPELSLADLGGERLLTAAEACLLLYPATKQPRQPEKTLQRLVYAGRRLYRGQRVKLAYVDSPGGRAYRLADVRTFLAACTAARREQDRARGHEPIDTTPPNPPAPAAVPPVAPPVADLSATPARRRFERCAEHLIGTYAGRLPEDRIPSSSAQRAEHVTDRRARREAPGGIAQSSQPAWRDA